MLKHLSYTFRTVMTMLLYNIKLNKIQVQHTTNEIAKIRYESDPLSPFHYLISSEKQ